MNTVAAILAGGKSTRMGQDKANLPSLTDAETTMLRRTADLASAVFETVFVVGRGKPDDWTSPEGTVTFLPDESPDLGPMGGLATILRYLSSQNREVAVALLACDLPLLTVESLEWLAVQPLGRQGVVVQNGEQKEPLFAIYTPECLPLLEEQLAAGRRSLQKRDRRVYGERCAAEGRGDTGKCQHGGRVGAAAIKIPKARDASQGTHCPDSAIHG
jgi:molybdopterin-guanine dinucleotide biosynthesis protein A